MLKNFKNLSLPEIEKKVLEFWRENRIFEKSVKKPAGKSPKGDYVFYDGPPFATGLPHYGHILASIIKDAIPRYQTMKGRRVPRRWGWDCHGLPIENEIEKDLGLKTKKDIENIGIKNFNEAARKKVLAYASDWKEIIPRIGRWVDMENDYKTMDADYTESVLWIFKTLYDKGLIYEGYKSMHLCPRCETTLSNFEVAQGYKEIEDISIYVKFELKETKPQTLKPKTYLLVWTTTPWTLPGNVALAINSKINYVKIKIEEEYFILAKNRLSVISFPYKIIEEFKGIKLIGLTYEPPFDYFKAPFKIYPADFVSAEEGTGIVHIAPAFGEDDMNLAQENNLPFIQHVSMDGKFKPEVKDFAGLPVKPKENHQSTDIEIIKWLAKENKLFSKQKITHSYPHCWRCDTPLLNYAASSWFMKATEIKNKLLLNNKKINWIPAHIRDGRFGKWLEEARDWAISRTRFWGAPLPVWRCEKCEKIKVIGSLEELKRNIKKTCNKYFVMRHGEAESNLFNFISSNYKNEHHLTERGKKQVKAAAKIFRQGQDKIDFIFSSDFLRCRETAEIVAEAVGYPKNKIIFDKRLREINTGIFDGRKPQEYHDYFSSLEEKFYKTPPKGENLIELKKRVSEFLYEIAKKYSGKNILIVSHEYPIWMIFSGAAGADVKKSIEIRKNKSDFLKTAEIKKLDFIPIPHNDDFELDFHRPYIDEIEFPCTHSAGASTELSRKSSGQVCGGVMKRIPDVFDCWFESGAMPYAQAHYPFERRLPFPAEFIAEGVDQTRGWFYTLLVLSTALFNKPAYKNVIVNGIILAESGQKMSKRLKNYPDPMEIVNKYGADALRLYLLSSPAVRGESFNFSEKGVDEIYKKTILRFWNVYSFYDLYAERKIKAKSHLPKIKSKNVLDKWILARLNETILGISKNLEKYELDKASRPINDFIDDLSTWYIRRSRVRFKVPFHLHIHKKNKKPLKDRDDAIETTKFILIEFSKAVSPFIPFIAEVVYKLTDGKKESVHLDNWPDYKSLSRSEKNIIEKMKIVREIVEKVLAIRQAAGIKVRQPLASLKIKNQKLKIKNDKELLDLIKDEINVKKIIFDSKIKNDFELDTKITNELKKEGQIRELVRIIQDLRKDAGYTPKDRVVLYAQTGDELFNLISQNLISLKQEIGAKEIAFKKTAKFDAEEETKIDGFQIWLGIKKI